MKSVSAGVKPLALKSPNLTNGTKLLDVRTPLPRSPSSNSHQSTAPYDLFYTTIIETLVPQRHALLLSVP